MIECVQTKEVPLRMDNRQFKLLVGLVIVSGLVGGALSSRLLPGRPAFAEEAGQVVTAREFRLVDEGGQVRAKLRVQKEGGPSLDFFDTEGRPHTALRLFGKDWPVLVFMDRASEAEPSQAPMGRTAPPKPDAAVSQEWPKTWGKVASWSGPGNKKTERFTVDGEWRIKYYSAGGHLGIFLCDAQGEKIELIENILGHVDSRSYLYCAGTYTLDIAGGNDWAVCIETKD